MNHQPINPAKGEEKPAENVATANDGQPFEVRPEEQPVEQQREEEKVSTENKDQARGE